MSATDRLAGMRDQIEAIDRQIVELIAERVRLARQLGPIKRSEGLSTMDPEREAAVIRHSAELARSHNLPDEDIRRIFWHVIALSRQAQRYDTAD